MIGVKSALRLGYFYRNEAFNPFWLSWIGCSHCSAEIQ